MIIYNYCLHEVNIESCQLFYYTKITLRCLKILKFCFVVNKIISSIENTNMEYDWQKQDLQYTSGLPEVIDQAITYCLPLHYICLECPSGCLSCQQIFQNHWFIVHRVKKYVRYNNNVHFIMWHRSTHTSSQWKTSLSIWWWKTRFIKKKS